MDGCDTIAIKTFKNEQVRLGLMKPVYFSVCDIDTRLVGFLRAFAEGFDMSVCV